EADNTGAIYDDIPEYSWATATRREKTKAPKWGSAEGELEHAAVAAHEVDGQGVWHRHPAVAEPEGLIELLDRPQGLRAEFVREDGVIRVPADRQGQGKAEGIRFLPRQRSEEHTS